MRKLLILAGAVSVLSLPLTALEAKPGGGGGGGGGGHGHGNDRHEERGGNSDRFEGRHGNDDRDEDRDRDSVGYARHDRADRGEGYRHRCPPGLAKKHNGCLPPGQVSRVGQRSPWDTNRYVDYGNLPSSYRDRFPDTSGQQYYTSGNRVYIIDRATQLVRSIFNIGR